MFTVEQYDQAIEALHAARKQAVDGTHISGCDVCGGDCNPHQCRHNPLFAMHMCEQLGKQADELHSTLHILAGFDTRMGEQIGPAAVTVLTGKQRSFQAEH